jgi:hypothetical protein
VAAFGEFDEGLRALEKRVVETALKFADSFDEQVGQQWEEAGESLDLALRAARLVAPSARVLFDSSYRPPPKVTGSQLTSPTNLPPRPSNTSNPTTLPTPHTTLLTSAAQTNSQLASVLSQPSVSYPPQHPGPRSALTALSEYDEWDAPSYLSDGNLLAVSGLVDGWSASTSTEAMPAQAVLDNVAHVGQAPTKLSLPLSPLVSDHVSKAVNTTASHSRGRDDVIEVKRKLVEINEATEASGSAAKRHRRRHVGDLEPPNAMDTTGQEHARSSAAHNWEPAGSLNSRSPFPTKSEVAKSIRAGALEEPPVTDSAVVLGKNPFSKRLNIDRDLLDRDLFDGSLSPEPDIDRELVEGSLSPNPYEAELAEILANPFFADLHVEGPRATSSNSKVQLTSGEQAEVCSSSQVNDNLVIVIMFLPLYRKACRKGLTWLKPGS